MKRKQSTRFCFVKKLSQMLQEPRLGLCESSEGWGKGGDVASFFCLFQFYCPGYVLTRRITRYVKVARKNEKKKKKEKGNSMCSVVAEEIRGSRLY